VSEVAVLKRERRSQAARSASTRARLLDATIECLNELGYARTTTPEIARRAGLSRGAQLHHFPTKADLVISAVEHLFERRHAEFRAAIEALPASADRATAAIDLLWSMISGPTFYAWLETAVAARTDPELRPHFERLSTGFAETIERTFRDILPPVGDVPGVFYDAAPSFVFALLDGLALHRIQSPDDRPVGEVLRALKALAQLVGLSHRS
jgi:AcrR family transcriptional regulator